MGIAQPLLRWPLARAEACVTAKQTLDPHTCGPQNRSNVIFGVASFGSIMLTKSALMLAAALVGGGATAFWHLRRARHPRSAPADRNADPMELAIVDVRRREVEELLRDSARQE